MTETSSPTPQPDIDERLVNTKSPAKIQQMFSEIAGTYDLLNHLLSLNIDKRWRSKVARRVVTPECRRILDVCGGTGDLALALHYRANEIEARPQIICSDFTPGMMKIGKQKFEKESGSSAPVALVADTTSLPFSDDQFDVVSVAFGIRNVADTMAGLREMARVCRPGGSVAVLEFSEGRHRLINTGFSVYFRHILPTIGRLVTGTRAYSYLQKSVEKFPDGQAFADMLSAATGSPTEIHRLTFGIATLYVSAKTK